jgi:hypothetical protein
VENQKKVEDEFPGIQWQKKSYYLQGDTDVPYLWWTEVPFDRILTDENAFFHVRRVSPSTWRRRCYGYYGMGRGLILYEDRVTHWNDSLPPRQYIDWNNSMRVEGDWKVQKAGNYQLEINTADVFWFFLDGKKVLEVSPGDSGPKTYNVFLSAGNHHVELVTAFAAEHTVPVVLVKTPDNSSGVPLDDLVAGGAAPSMSGTTSAPTTAK